MMFFGWFLLIALFLLIFKPDFLKNLFNSGNSETLHEDISNNRKAKEILKERYARGDISEDEYRKVLRNIEGGE
ncbi:MAG: SHOCT domain-containing protein [Kosmotogaceae bacterium]